MEQREAKFRRDVLRTSSAVAAGGLLALLLSAIGLYAVVSFAVAERTREIGIRTALGAERGQVVRMFFAKGLAAERARPDPGASPRRARDAADCDDTELAARELTPARCGDRRGRNGGCFRCGVDSGASGEHDRSECGVADRVIRLGAPTSHTLG